MKTRIQYLLPLFLFLACDKVERDWTRCNDTYSCHAGFTCLDFRCMPNDGGSDSGGDVADGRNEAAGDGEGIRADATSREAGQTDGSDAPMVVDSQPAADLRPIEADAHADGALSDAAADAPLDAQPADALGTCSNDFECPATAPLCIDFTCGKCRGDLDCASRADAGLGGGVCDSNSGRCVACTESGDCSTATAPICLANQCVPCQSAANPAAACRAKDTGAPVCEQTSGKCLGCLANSDCATDADGGADGGDDGGLVGGVCNLATNLCAGCLAHADCKDPSRPLCGSTLTCVPCAVEMAPANGCATKNPAQPVCKAASGACVECTASSDCTNRADGGVDGGGSDGGALGKVCSAANTCVECNGNTDCTASPTKEFCMGHTCVGCRAAAASACTGATPVCATSGTQVDQCVECMTSGDCKVAGKPVCDANQCRGCKKDNECSTAAGVCGLDGSCPAADGIIYVQNSGSCSLVSRGSGTSASPYCFPDDAVAALSASKSIILVTGGVTPQAGLTIALPGVPVLISGRSSPATAIIHGPAAGTPPIISVTAGEVTLRDLTISGGAGQGVSASDAILHMDRCYVLNNMGNGIVTTSSAFDIANTVIAGNGGTTNSGVTLGAYGGSGPKTFWFNTVVNNGLIGVVCGGTSPLALTGILASANGTADFSANCAPNSTSSTAAPAFGSDYHLTSTSACVNAGGTSCPPDDIDGESRPKGAACDCGADEL